VPLDPPISDKVPEASELTGYDCEHLASYLRLLDADAQGADWAEVNRTVLHIDFAREPERARGTLYHEQHAQRVAAGEQTRRRSSAILITGIVLSLLAFLALVFAWR
jgi:hypothetical protein